MTLCGNEVILADRLTRYGSWLSVGDRREENLLEGFQSLLGKQTLGRGCLRMLHTIAQTILPGKEPANELALGDR